MPTTDELQDQVDTLTTALSTCQIAISALTTANGIRDSQLAAATRSTLDHNNKIQELRIVAGLDVPNVPIPPI